MNTIQIIKTLEFLIKQKASEEKLMDAIAELIQWVPAAEKEETVNRCVMFCVLSAANKEVSWGEDAYEREVEADARFVNLTGQQWWQVKECAKMERWFKTSAGWNEWRLRVDGKRREKAVESHRVARELDLLDRLLEERRDLMRYPAVAGSQEGYDSQICDIERVIRTLPAGKWRLEMEYEKERPALQARIDEIVRQVKLTRALKDSLAAKRIQATWHARMSTPCPSVDTESSGEHPDDVEMGDATGATSARSLFNVVRRTHDDAFVEHEPPTDEYYDAELAATQRQWAEYENQCDHMIYDAAVCVEQEDAAFHAAAEAELDAEFGPRQVWFRRN